MLLAVAAVLIDAKTSRNFLEQAQALAGQLAWALTVLAGTPSQENSTADRLDAALRGLKTASTPLLANLGSEMRSAVSGDDST